MPLIAIRTLSPWHKIAPTANKLSWGDLLGVLVGENVYWNVKEFSRKHTKKEIGKEQDSRANNCQHGAKDF